MLLTKRDGGAKRSTVERRSGWETAEALFTLRKEVGSRCREMAMSKCIRREKKVM